MKLNGMLEAKLWARLCAGFAVGSIPMAAAHNADMAMKELRRRLGRGGEDDPIEVANLGGPVFQTADELDLPSLKVGMLVTHIDRNKGTFTLE